MYLGFDTSNYTTSAALYDPKENSVVQNKKLLPVKENNLGLRQSDAVFSHVKQLGDITRGLFEGKDFDIEAVGVSSRPRNLEGSYMPCFLVGEMVGNVVSSVNNVPIFYFSHQQGHISAALYSSGRLDLIGQRFIAFHLSGGTTEALLVEPDENDIIRCTEVARSLDLKAGQVVDRVGVMLGLGFPAGKELEKLALSSDRKFKVRPSMKDNDCSLSGIENKCMKMFSDGESREDIALFALESIYAALSAMTDGLLDVYGRLPLLYAGGVMSNSIIRKRMEKKYGGIFADPVFSSDNAAGIAVLTSIATERKGDTDKRASCFDSIPDQFLP